jgi:mono/diheme cytochrome c family protein
MLLPGLGGAQAAGQWRDAQRIYAQTCAYCHGVGVAAELRGRGMPPQYIAFCHPQRLARQTERLQ